MAELKLTDLRLLELINAGGFGKIYRVQLPDGQFAALKYFDPANPENRTEEARRRFQREVSVQSRLPPSVAIPIWAHDLTSESPWYLMPLADMSLKPQIIEDRRNKTISKKALADVLDALEVIHEQEYVHRDLKPENILLQDGRWKLSDFGLVLPITAQTTTLTSSSAWGSQYYAAPEQATDFHYVDTRVDVYAFGCILYEWCTDDSRTPYGQHRVDGPLGAIIAKCTETDPDARYGNVAELRMDLFNALSRAQVVLPVGRENWVETWGRFELWGRKDMVGFLNYLRSIKGQNGEEMLFESLRMDHFSKLHKVNESLWARISTWYCEYAETHQFIFDFCDVIASILDLIYNLGTLSTKSAAALAAAGVGASHNRWFVMRRLHSMTGPHISEAIARRFATDIQARSAYDGGKIKKAFIACALNVSTNPLTIYHPLIASVLG